MTIKIRRTKDEGKPNDQDRIAYLHPLAALSFGLRYSFVIRHSSLINNNVRIDSHNTSGITAKRNTHGYPRLTPAADWLPATCSRC